MQRPSLVVALAAILALALILIAAPIHATETENFGIQILPTPGPVVVDGAYGDWDLSGSIFACGDVQQYREKFGVWVSTMYDADNLYVLCRWKDDTPLNNSGSTAGDFGWNGDCVQLRVVADYNTPTAQKNVFNCWRGADGRDVVERDTPGKTKNSPKGDDVKPLGAQQAFTVDADNLGYVQEIAIPWSLITSDGKARGAGDMLVLTVEPNFTAGPTNGRLSIKDIFRPGITLDRVFTFQNNRIWGEAPLLAAGHVAPRSVRLSDAREFATTLVDGKPVIDWTGIDATTETGFKPITFDLPADGVVSLQLLDAEGHIVRQVLTAEPLAKGAHTIKWDGLTEGYATQPGKVAAAGTYTWRGITHSGIGIALRGWALGEGSAPWDGPNPGDNWGGDMGPPSDIATDGERMYLGWSGSEAGKALVATDFDGKALWRHKRGGFGGAGLIAVDGGVAYVMDGQDGSLYCLDTATAMYRSWAGGTSSSVLVRDLWGDAPWGTATPTATATPAAPPTQPNGLDALGGRLYMTGANADGGCLAVLDVASGKLLQRIALDTPGAVKALATDRVLVVTDHGERVLAVNPATGATSVVLDNLGGATGMTASADGTMYVAVGAPDHQVRVFDPAGKLLRSIGRQGGRPLIGPWQADALNNIAGIEIDARGQLWVAEHQLYPRRFTIWNAATGALVRELFGPTHYGASGATIHPRDPNVMVGEGCEWRLDPVTGKSVCVGVFDVNGGGYLGGHSFARFASGANGRDYLAVANLASSGIAVYERLAPGDYRLRATITADRKANTTTFWSDANDDQQAQDDERSVLKAYLLPGGYYFWSMYMGADLTFCGGGSPLKVNGFTACGAPTWDLATYDAAFPLPPGLPSLDNRLLLTCEGTDTSQYRCYDMATGKLLWQYANPWHGVHGSHNAPPPERGLLRGTFGPVGAAKVPVAGTIFAVNSNVGEWHLLTQDGYYLTRLFEPDGLKIKFPAAAVPGARIEYGPSGMGGEDFGGSLVQGADGKVYLQAGKVAVWNCELTGLDTIRTLPGGTVEFGADDVRTATRGLEARLQQRVGVKRLTVAHAAAPITFTGDLAADFKDVESVTFKKQDEAAVRAALAWDATTLYVAWDVADPTPWVNGATEAPMLYLGGDTVDLQLGSDAAAPKDRAEPVVGDLRLSIGALQGTPTAVVYRKVVAAGQPTAPWAVSSGIVKDYRHDFVGVLADARIEVRVRPGAGYLVEAAIPLSALGLTAPGGKLLRGDLGVTHGDTAGQRTRLRSYWSNVSTGIVDDAVFELKMEPKNWGEWQFKP